MQSKKLDLLSLQQQQFSHDQRNHSDIICLHKNDRLKHYGLHFAKYVGRLSRGEDEEKSLAATVTDCTLVCLSAANTLGQKLEYEKSQNFASSLSEEPILALADAAGRFCDACEKIDHLESFVDMARRANSGILVWVVDYAEQLQLDLNAQIMSRRCQLRERQFYILD